MKNKSGMIWSFIFFIMMAGCSTHQQLAGIEHGVTSETPQVHGPGSPGVKPDTESASSLGVEDEEGYQIRPVEIEIEGGRPYLPVGAEFTTQDGKVSLGDVIKAVADHKGFSVSWADDVDQQRLVDCNIQAADNFYDALNNILRQLDYFYTIEEDTIVVKYKETRKYNMAMPDFSETLTTSLGGNMLPTNEDETGMAANTLLKNESPEFNFWDNLATTLDSIVQCDGCPPPVINRTTGTITVSASRSIHRDVEEHLSLIRRESYKQVIIEAKIIEVALEEGSEKGINWEGVFKNQGLTIGVAPDGGVLWSKDTGWNRFLDSLTITDTSWEVIVSAFEEFGDTRIISNPKLHIMNGHGAVLSTGKVRTYLDGCSVTVTGDGGSAGTQTEPTTESVMEGLSIGIKANILGEDKVVLYVFPAITKILQFVDISDTDCGMVQAPETAVREMATYANVRDGEVLVIGGLISEDNVTNTSSVPYLGGLPYLGRLFSYESVLNIRTELVILIKPRILIPD